MFAAPAGGRGREKRLGFAVSHPDLAVAGSDRGRRWDGAAGAIGAGVVLAVTMLAAIVFGSVPASAGLTIVTLFPAAGIDIRERRIPDVWVGAAAAVFLAVSTLEWMIGSTPAIGGTLAGAIVVGGPILLLHLLSPAAMGFGDVKAAVVIGMAVGSLDWQLGLVALTLAAGSAATFGVLRRTRTIAFGPFLVLGGWLALVGNSVWLAPLADGRAGT